MLEASPRGRLVDLFPPAGFSRIPGGTLPGTLPGTLLGTSGKVRRLCLEGFGEVMSGCLLLSLVVLRSIEKIVELSGNYASGQRDSNTLDRSERVGGP